MVKINWKDLIKQVVYSNVTSNLYKKEEQTIVSQLNIIHFFSVINGKPKQNELEGKIQTTDGEKKIDSRAINFKPKELIKNVCNKCV